MKRLLSLLIVVLLLTSCNISKKERSFEKGSSQDHLIMSTLWFQQSAEVNALFYQAFNIASFMLEKHLKDLPDNSKPAIVIDIDETILDNSPFQGEVILRGEPYSQSFWEEWTSLAKAEPLPGALEFLKKAEILGVSVFYVTNRKETEREGTLRNLKEQGFPFAQNEYLIMRTQESSKENRRQKIAENYSILLLIGDNLNDLADVFENRDEDLGFSAAEEFKNEFGNRFIVLPNPMYGEWERPFYKEMDNPDENEKYRIRKERLKNF
jgi:5'-nucleotidase (lipoprotein e(P4) family)